MWGAKYGNVKYGGANYGEHVQCGAQNTRLKVWGVNYKGAKYGGAKYGGAKCGALKCGVAKCIDTLFKICS